MIKILVAEKHVHTALSILELYDLLKVKPNVHTYAFLLKGSVFADADYLASVLEHCKKHNLDSNVYVRNHVIQALMELREYDKAAAEFTNMTQGEIQPDNYTFSYILACCTDATALFIGKLVHQHIIDRELKTTSIVNNFLLRMYINCGSLEDAMLLFRTMKEQKQDVDKYTYSIILSGCADAGAIDHGMYVYEQMSKTLNEQDIVSMTCLLKLFVKAKRIDSAVELFKSMIHNGPKPNKHTVSIMLSGIAEAKLITVGEYVHNYVTQSKVKDDVVNNALVKMYVECGSIRQALNVFRTMTKPNEYTYSALFAGCADAGQVEAGTEVINHLQRSDTRMSDYIYTALIKMHCKLGSIDQAMIKFQEAIKDNIYSENMFNVILTGCAEAKHGDYGMQVYEQLKASGIVPNILVNNALVKMFVLCGYFTEGIDTVKNMTQNGQTPDEYTYSILFDGIAEYGMLHYAKEAHRLFVASDSMIVLTSLVHMYCRCGSLVDAADVFEQIKSKFEQVDVFAWSAMILGYGTHGRGEKALDLYNEMIGQGIKPNSKMFSTILTTCQHNGFLDLGISLFNSMAKYGIKPEKYHYGCMIDALGRQGHLSEAEEMLAKIDGINDVAYMALLSACRLHSDVVRAERIASEMLKHNPRNDAVLVMLANIYDETGHRDKSKEIWARMKSEKIQKKPGMTMVEVNGRMLKVYARTIPEEFKEELLATMDKTYKELAGDGYTTNVAQVMDDVDDETKRMILCRHSEKIALFIAMPRVASEEPIRIIKNLRVCVDCHNFNKAMSKRRKGEIIMRDSKVFHHFKNGQCSCGDTW
jgi:pentatricopeptide repeat protein